MRNEFSLSGTTSCWWLKTWNTGSSSANTKQSAHSIHLFWMLLTAVCDYLKVSRTSLFWQQQESARERKTKPFVPRCRPAVLVIILNLPCFWNNIFDLKHDNNCILKHRIITCSVVNIRDVYIKNKQRWRHKQTKQKHQDSHYIFP